MAVNPPNIPALPSKTDPEVRRAFDSLKAYFAKVGRLITVADLVNAGIVTETGGTITPVDPSLDTTIPPQITGFTVTGAFNSILLQWDDPRYKPLAYVEVWRAEVDDLGQAAMVGTTIATMYADTPPDSSLAVTYYYWVRIISTAGIAGPYNDTAGTPGTTANDPNYLLELLTGQLTESQLYGDLTARIDKIDAPGTGLDQTISDLADKQLEFIARQYDEQFLALMREKNISDATVDIDPATGAISLKASANVTTDVESRISALEFNMDAGEGKIETLTHTVEFDRVSMTDYNTAISQLEGDISLRATTSYVDTAMLGTMDNLLPESFNIYGGDSPFAIMNLILHGNRADYNSLVNKANIAQAQFDIKTNADAISAEATARLVLAAKVDQNAAALVSEQTTRATADAAEASARETLAARVTSTEGRLTTNEAAIVSEQTARANADAAEASARTTLAARVTTAEGNITANAALIQSEQTARATADSALSSSITTLQTTVSGHTTSIQTQQSSIDGVRAQYTVKIDNNGYVSGFGLASTLKDATPTSEFIVVADKFSIAPVATSAAAVDGSPFYYLTAPQVVNGVTVPAGAYIKTAFIADATIATAQIQNLAVDSAKIAEAAIITAKIADAAITTAKIGSAQITTAKIADAAITTAKIGTAQVDTLRIGANAVTVSVGASGTTATIDAEGQPVMVMVDVDVVMASATGINWGTAGGTINLYRDGSLLRSYAYQEYGYWQWTKSYTILFKDTAPTGNHTYSITATHSITACNLFLTGLKR